MCGVKEIIEKIRELEKEDKKEVIRDIKSQKLTLSRCVKLLKKTEKNFDFFYPQAIFGCIRGGDYDIINIVDDCKRKLSTICEEE